ncbi:flotillin-like protein 1 [Dorcoceras hygrometricum]|uniref:Flotillin-like protein 1 n=1 Tax=Dorcoceras hygrometricum TaxID=472368 RepID=A0A2Z7DA40_9LAMI|nr:flotillin-like protein 1 [Dorcoceras hygrometricum]
MGNADPNKTKAGNKYEVKPQYEELSKQINMQHATNQCYEFMRLSKEISQLDRCNNRQIISCRLYTKAHSREATDLTTSNIDMFKLKAAKGCSIRTTNPQNSTSQSRQGTADLTACEQIAPSFKITKPKISSNKSVQGSSSNADVDSRRWYISAYPAVLLQPCPVVIAILFLPDFEGERQYRTLISLLVWCKDERVIPVCLCTPQWPLTILRSICCFPGYSVGHGFDPAGGAPGGR